MDRKLADAFLAKRGLPPKTPGAPLPPASVEKLLGELKTKYETARTTPNTQTANDYTGFKALLADLGVDTDHAARYVRDDPERPAAGVLDERDAKTLKSWLRAHAIEGVAVEAGKPLALTDAQRAQVKGEYLRSLKKLHKGAQGYATDTLATDRAIAKRLDAMPSDVETRRALEDADD